MRVGEGFAITCILRASESVEWQKDGVVLEGQSKKRWRREMANSSPPRWKRNVSELEEFNLRRYYNAVVDYHRMRGGAGYSVAAFLSSREAVAEAEPEEIETEETSTASPQGFIFTEGRVQGRRPPAAPLPPTCDPSRGGGI